MKTGLSLKYIVFTDKSNFVCDTQFQEKLLNSFTFGGQGPQNVIQSVVLLFWTTLCIILCYAFSRYTVAEWFGVGLAIARSRVRIPPTAAVYQRQLSVPPSGVG